MVGAAIAVLAEGAPEFADQHHHRVLPCGTLLVGEGGEPAPELLEPGSEKAARPARADHRHQPVEKSRLKVARTLALAELDGVLRLEMASAQVLGARERYESRLPVLVQPVDAVAERRMQAPFGSKRQDAFPRDRDVGTRLVIETVRDGNQDVRRVVAAPQENKKEAALPCRGCRKETAGKRREEKAGGIPEKGSFVHRKPAIGS